MKGISALLSALELGIAKSEELTIVNPTAAKNLKSSPEYIAPPKMLVPQPTFTLKTFSRARTSVDS